MPMVQGEDMSVTTLHCTLIPMNTPPAGGVMVYQYMELKDATDTFSPENKIGKGGFCVVYKGVLRHAPVAVKLLSEVSCIICSVLLSMYNTLV